MTDLIVTQDGNLTNITAPALADRFLVVKNSNSQLQDMTFSVLLASAVFWTPVSDSWTYASASTITVPSDATTVYQKGMKIRLKQGGGYKYFVVSAVSATLLTVLVSTDYTVANAAITDIAYSFAEKPFGFPDKFNFTPTITYAGGTTNPTSVTVNIANWRVIGGDLFVTIQATLVKGTGDRTQVNFSIPYSITDITPVVGVDSVTAAGFSPGFCYMSGATVQYIRTMANNGNYYINGSAVMA